MEIKDRIALLDSLLALNEQAGLPENQVVSLADFLASQPETARDSILDYIRQEDSSNRLMRFAKLSNMEPGQRDGILKAMGLQLGQKNGLVQEFFGATSDSTNRAKQAINELTEIRKALQEGFLEPLAQLFGLGKLTKK